MIGKATDGATVPTDGLKVDSMLDGILLGALLVGLRVGRSIGFP